MHRSDSHRRLFSTPWARPLAIAMAIVSVLAARSESRASVTLVDTFGASNGFGSTGFGIISNQGRLALRFPSSISSLVAIESVTVVVVPFSPASRMWLAGGTLVAPDLSELDSFDIPAGPPSGSVPQVVTVPANRRTILNAGTQYWLVWEGAMGTREAGAPIGQPAYFQDGFDAWQQLGLEIAFRVTAQPLGACCNILAGSCTLTTQSVCTEIGSAFRGDGTTCTPANCTPPVVRGACCLGFPTQNCVIRSSSECAAGGGRYFGDRTACPPPGAASLCCPGDVNGSGGTTVQDIFTFLAGYFAGCP